MKKKITKTILAMMTAAMLMVPFITMSAFATEASGGLPPAEGNLFIHKYIGAPVDGAANDGSEHDTGLWTQIQVNNLVYDLYKVSAPITANPAWPEVPPLGAYLIDVETKNLLVYDGTTMIGEYLLEAADPASIKTGSSGISPQAGVAIAEGLDQGIYLVVENLAGSVDLKNPSGNPVFISTTVAPFLVAVPMTNQDGSGWLTDVHVYPKSERLSITKAVNVDLNPAKTRPVVVGDLVDYTLTASVPGDIATGKKYEITDLVDKALNIDEKDVEVSTIDDAGLIEEEDYEIKIEYDEETGASKLTVSFKGSGLSKLADKTSVVVEYECEVNSIILGYPDYTISNTAEVEFTNAANKKFEAESETIYIHTAAIEITNKDQNGAALSDPEFKIATSEENAKNGYFVRQDPITKELIDYGMPGWESLTSVDDYKITSNGFGKATFKGLRNFGKSEESGGGGKRDWQTYFIVQTKVPAGYNLLAAPKEVTFAGDEINYTYKLEVQNSQGFLLPNTGGVGTMMWMIAGITLIGVASLIVITKRKKAAENY